MLMRQRCSADLNGLGHNTGPVHQVGGKEMDKVGGRGNSVAITVLK